ncbi:MAG: SPW repeat protein [Parachlamydiales bacterium]|nr:SPW repeat protein [Parachlamydiales bacterium]
MIMKPMIDLEVLKKHHERTIWARLATLILGIWLMTSPATFGYTIDRPMMFNDIISGAILVILSAMALSYRFRFLTWFIAIMGLWLGFAPLALWSKTATGYLNDTIIGALTLAFSIIVPFRPEGNPGDAEIPQGWSYNPSSWFQRAPIVLFGFLGWFIARYLAAYQLGYIDYVYDPIFGDGTMKVITSNVSKMFPVSDAGLGAFAYSLEALLALKGSSRRWYTMPWTVLIFGLLVVPLGFVSICLVILQPSVVGAWCGPCLFMAFCMLIMLALSIDEVVATLQYLNKVRKHHREHFWRVFWYGGEVEGTIDTRSARFGENRMWGSLTWGTSIPWTLIISLLIGVWMLCVPSVFNVVQNIADTCYIVGALTVVVSIISMAEVVRTFRFVNILFGIWIIISPLVMPLPECMQDVIPVAAHCKSYLWNGIICGLLLILLSIPRGRIKERYGTWNSWIV